MSNLIKSFYDKNNYAVFTASTVTPESMCSENNNYDNRKHATDEHHTNSVPLPATSLLLFQKMLSFRLTLEMSQLRTDQH